MSAISPPTTRPTVELSAFEESRGKKKWERPDLLKRSGFRGEGGVAPAGALGS
jgi:hypothetical protein